MCSFAVDGHIKHIKCLMSTKANPSCGILWIASAKAENRETLVYCKIDGKIFMPPSPYKSQTFYGPLLPYAHAPHRCERSLNITCIALKPGSFGRRIYNLVADSVTKDNLFSLEITKNLVLTTGLQIYMFIINLQFRFRELKGHYWASIITSIFFIFF